MEREAGQLIITRSLALSTSFEAFDKTTIIINIIIII